MEKSRFAFPQPHEVVFSCGHSGKDLICEKMQEDLVVHRKLGGEVEGAKWRVTCAACAKDSLSPRMVWIGSYSRVAKDLLDEEGLLL